MNLRNVWIVLTAGLSLAGSAAGQPTDTLVRTDGTVLKGYVTAFPCAQIAGDQRISFQANGLPVQTPALAEIQQLQLGGVVLSIKALIEPSAEQAQVVRNYIHSDPVYRNSFKDSFQLSLAATLPLVCGGPNPPDVLTKKDGTVMKGTAVAATCPAAGAPPQFAFQPSGQLVQTVAAADVRTLQLGAVLLASDENTPPSVGEAQNLAAYLKADPGSRSLPTLPLRLSLTAAAPFLCQAAAPTTGVSESGYVNLSGTLSSGATIQRLISGEFLWNVGPAVPHLGRVGATFDFNTAYGDSIKGSTTTKSSQIYSSYLKLYTELRPSPTTGTNFVVWGEEYHSFSQGAELRQGYGGGISQGLGNGLLVEGDIWYVHDSLYGPASTFSSAAARIYESYQFLRLTSPFSFTESLESEWPFRSSRALYLNGTTNFGYKLSSNLNLTATYTDTYFRNAPKGFKQNYGKLTLGFTYLWSH